MEHYGHGDSNTAGQLGQNDTTNRSSPVQVPGTTWSNCFSGCNYAILQLKLMEHYGHGDIMSHGQLGQNNTTKYSSPVQVPGTNWAIR